MQELVLEDIRHPELKILNSSRLGEMIDECVLKTRSSGIMTPDTLKLEVPSTGN